MTRTKSTHWLSTALQKQFSRLFILGAMLLATAVAQAQSTDTYPGVAKDGYADIPGAKLFYADTGGAGFPIVLLHAGTGNARVWEYQLPAFVAAGFRAIVYDRRGTGRTTIDPAGPAGTAADDLDALMKHLKIEKFVLVGTAAGGIVSADYALSYPSKLRALVIANSLVSANAGSEMIGRLLPSQFSSLPPDFKELAPSYRASNRAGTQRWIELEKQTRAPDPRPLPQPAKSQVTLQALEGLRVPTLILTGEADLYSPPPYMQQFASRIPGAETLWVREVGHSTYWEKPEVFNKAIIDFIRKH